MLASMKNKNKKYTSINKRLSISFIGIITATAIAISICLIFVFSNIIKNRIIEEQKIFMKENKTNIENLISNVNQVSMNLCSDNVIADILNKAFVDELDQYNSIDKLTQQFKRYVNTSLSNYVNTYNATLYLLDDFEISSMLGSKKIQSNNQNLGNLYNMDAVKDENWLKKAIDEDGAPYTFTLNKDDKMVYVARLIKNINIKKPDYSLSIGVMVIGISTSQFGQQVEALSLTPHSEVYIVNNLPTRQQIIYGTSDDFFGISVINHPKLIMAEEFKAGETVVIDNQKYLFMKYSTYWDWDIISIIPFVDISNKIRPTIWIAIIISLIAIIVGIVLVKLVSYSITKPLKKLTQIMYSIDKQENIVIYPKFITKRSDEVALLYESFDKMMKRIQQLIENVYLSGIKQKEAELLVLQAQINPHFIYNTLDSINWIAMCNDNDDIVDLVTSLADIVRYSIKNSYEKVKLSDEILHVKNYIRIQTIQSKYPIKVKIDIEDNYLNFIMPKFLIQPLVENSVIHGFKHSTENGQITISCKRKQEIIIIDVTDNGDGADVAKLNKYLNGEIDFLTQSDGFGIKNVNDRIKLSYGNEYGLSFLSNDKIGTTARIRLPIKDNIK